MEKVDLKGFKPCLADNFGVRVEPNWEELLIEPELWIASIKLEGIRCEAFPNGEAKSRALKRIKSVMVQKLVKELQDSIEDPCIIEGELWGLDLTLPEINHFVKSEDITSEKTSKKYKSLYDRTKGSTEKGWKFPGRDWSFLCTWPKELGLYVFDAYFPEHPSLTKEQRVARITPLIAHSEWAKLIPQFPIDNAAHAVSMFQTVVSDGGEGMMLFKKEAPYKFGRFNINSNPPVYKMKEDNILYIGYIDSVYETTVVKEGVEKTINELGRSKTSKLKEDRLPSGMAGGFHVTMKDGKTLKVGLNGYNHKQRTAILDNRSAFKGVEIEFSGKAPVKEGGVPVQSFYTRKHEIK